jgi:hypothetical protein
MIRKLMLAYLCPPIAVYMLVKQNYELQHAYEALVQNTNYSAYLADIVNRGEVELTEFDQIVLVNEFGATMEESAE